MKIILCIAVMMSLVAGTSALGQTGNVGIGTTTPGSKLSVNGNMTIGDVYGNFPSPSYSLVVQNQMGVGTINLVSRFAVNGNGVFGQHLSNQQAPTDGLAVEGNVAVGTIAPLSISTDVAKVSVTTSSGIGSYIYTSSSDLNGLLTLEKEGVADGNDQFIYFRANGGIFGSISGNVASSILYNTTSDVRLKENIRPTSFGIQDLMAIQVRDYNFKTNKREVQTGFIAQQLYTIFPNAVTKGGSDVSKPWMVDYGKITPLLVKAVQDQQAEIEALKKANTALRADLDQVALLRDELKQLKASLGSHDRAGEPSSAR